jgi:hypothetical protein
MVRFLHGPFLSELVDAFRVSASSGNDCGDVETLGKGRKCPACFYRRRRD